MPPKFSSRTCCGNLRTAPKAGSGAHLSTDKLRSSLRFCLAEGSPRYGWGGKLQPRTCYGNLRRLVLGVAFLVLAVCPLVAQASADEPPIKAESRWDWNEGRFYLDLSCPLPQDDEAVAPKRRYRAELYLQDHLKELFLEQIRGASLDSSLTIGEALKKDPEAAAALADLSDHLKFHYSKTNPDYNRLEMRYSVGIWDDLVPVFAPIHETNPLESVVVWHPSRTFSGLVIFAMGPLPWKGTGQSQEWKPALIFRLLNPQGEVVFDSTRMRADFLKKWGMGVYQESKFNEERWRDRIGFDPLRLVARGVWGTVPHDLVLSQEDWDRILGDEGNCRALSEGRILILWGTPAAKMPPEPLDENAEPFQIIAQPPAGTRIEQ